VDRVGLSGTNLTFKDATGQLQNSRTIDSSDRHSAVGFLLDRLEKQQAFASVKAVGHRVVHGMTHSEPERVTSELLDELHRITPYDPDHLPLEIELIEAFRQRHPGLPQVACFDTAFHRNMPRVASLLPIPRRYEAAGVRHYGFHGLSYEFLMEELASLGDPAATKGRVILAHLGNGASLAAVRDGNSIDTSMGFTPTSGLVMSSRSGDLDPGLGSYLARPEQMSAAQFQEMVNHGSGLLGVSEISSDLRDLLARNLMTFVRRKPWRFSAIRPRNGLGPSPRHSVDWTLSSSQEVSAKTRRSSVSGSAISSAFLELNWTRGATRRTRP
jgi:acetate kinase